MAASSSSQVVSASSWQVFIHFRGKELRKNFVSHVVGALKRAGIKYYIDSEEIRGRPQNILFRRIEESQIALCIFSSMYTESDWCLDELVKIMEEEAKEKLNVIPVFFNVKPGEVGGLKNDIAVQLYTKDRFNQPKMLLWENALKSVSHKMGLILDESR